MGTGQFERLAQPIDIGGVTARNRIMMATHGPRLPQKRYLRYLEERAQGGIALAGFNVGPLGLMQFPFGPGRSTPGGEMDLDGLPPNPLSEEGAKYYDSLVPAIGEWIGAVRKFGVVAVAQLYHPGAAQHTDGFQPIVSASPFSDEFEKHRAHALTDEEVRNLIKSYTGCSRRSVKAGAQILEMHGAHGYLIQQFLSPLMNHRTDEWGGSLDNRMRFLREAFAAAKAGAEGAPIGLRLTGLEPEGGLTMEDLVVIAKTAESCGAAYISISGGSYSGLWRGVTLPYVASAMTPLGPNVAVSAQIRRAVSIPVMVSGSIISMEQADEIVASGAADIVCMVRALMADPTLPAKGFAARAEETKPCIGGNECHYGRPVTCAVNPFTGREKDLELAPTTAPKRVLVVGAGPAGIECATAAAARGHHVTLMDKRGEVGGQLITLAAASRQARFGDYLRYARLQAASAPIELRLNQMADPSVVRALAPDVLVLATGAAWSNPIGISASEALENPSRVGATIVVVGGKDDHLGPMIVADYFSRQGRAVRLLVEGASPGLGVEAASQFALMRALKEQNVEIVPFTAATGLDAQGLHVRSTLTNEAAVLAKPETVIDLESRHADNAQHATFAGLAAQIQVIGDALSPRRMVHATLDGARLAVALP